MKWISVNDRLPEHHNPVISYSRTDGIIYDMCKIMEKDGDWMTVATRWTGTNPTHWMEIPKPPKD